MRRILDIIRADKQFVAILAISLLLGFTFTAWVVGRNTPEPRIIVKGPEVADPIPDHPVIPEDDGIEIFKVRDALPPLPEGVGTSADQTVAVRLRNEDGRTWYGSGFMIREGVAVSAAHILDHAVKPYRLTVTCRGDEVEASVLASDRGRDVVIIKAGCPGKKRRFDRTPLKDSETIYLAGYTYTFEHSDGTGVTADRYVRTASAIPTARLSELPEKYLMKDIREQLAEMKRRNLARHVGVTTVAIPGHSGSAVVREDGSIVGMVVIRDPMRSRSFIVTARLITQVMDNYGIAY